MRGDVRAIVVALGLAAGAAGAVAAQERPDHRHVMPPDTTNRRMPRDTSMARMPGMSHDSAPMRMAVPSSGIPETRDASGTAWQPDASPMYALHGMAGSWSLMLHGNAFLQYIDAGSERGAHQVGSINWFMGMARRPLAGGDLGLRAMVSLEPLTVGDCGHPDLLATGEFCKGRPIHDRQHPHDMFMEVAALYARRLTRSVGIQVYGGPAGEPALGPVAYPHRLSALWTPIAPISHHWQDATHIAFGVATAGLYGRSWKVEASAFNGREPDENRYDLDLGALDSYSGRVWLLPTSRVALQVSSGYLREAERAVEGGRMDVHRSTASVEYNMPLRRGGVLASTLVWGQNRAHGRATSSGLLEGSLDLDDRNVISARAELVEKSGEDLAVGDRFPALADGVYSVGKASLGYTRQFGGGALRPAVGASISLSFVPAALRPVYGSTASAGFAVFASVRAAPMHAMHQHAMGPQPTAAGRAGR